LGAVKIFAGGGIPTPTVWEIFYPEMLFTLFLAFCKALSAAAK
jgi:hypothetical protein